MAKAALDNKSPLGETTRVQYDMYLLVMNGHRASEPFQRESPLQTANTLPEEFRGWSDHGHRMFVLENFIKGREH